MYEPVDAKVSFPRMEEEILRFWEENRIFEKSVAAREGAEEFVFYDGPPFATGLPHFGHFVPNTIKDIIPRYQTMKGKRVERRFGWDCHGLPVEALVEKELGLNSKTDIERYGAAAFNEACRDSVLRYVSEWRSAITRLGRWVDFDNDYKTMDAGYMESIWWVMKSLHEKGLLYEGHYILPYCPRCATVLSNHELNLGGYRDASDPAITVRFRARGDAARGVPGGAFFLAWTTTPWTLPSNLALAVGPDVDYVLAEEAPDPNSAAPDSGPRRYVLAEARLPAYWKDPEAIKIVWRKKGAELAGAEYEPLFPYFAGEAGRGAFRVFAGDFVTTEDGSGIVHAAPGFGEDDARILKGTGIPVICPVDAECRFTSEVADFEGLFVKDADKGIIERLKAEGSLHRRDQILHPYPHCWRCSSPLIYRAVASWFVAVGKIKKDMLAANARIRWVPEHIKDGRFGKWLEGARDWAISRNRFWGNPLPIWKCPGCGKAICVGSRAELKELSGAEPEDLHKQFVDGIAIPCGSCGGEMRRVPEVLDCWFESGAMPYAQSHYPFENRGAFEARFPADFINEGLDQTRGWFYTLVVLGAALFGKPAFKNCVVSGLVLAADGKKMSKSLRNYTDPMEVVGEFGADALRLFLVGSAVVKADDLRYSDEGVRDVMKGIILPLWNAYGFFVAYANIDGVRPEAAPEDPANPLDQWILSEAQALAERVGAALDAYDLARAVEPIPRFIDMLNNWYIRRSRRRFWRAAEGSRDADKLEAYGALRAALRTLAAVAAPFMPFTADAIWRNLRGEGDPESVHLADFPVPRESLRDRPLEFRMAAARRAVSMGRALRSQHGIKARQPLRLAELVTRSADEKKALLEMAEIIREELNVKELAFRDNEEDLVEYEAKANFRAMGRELGRDMKAAAARIEELSQAEIRGLLDGASLSLDVPTEGGGSRAVDVDAGKLDIRRREKPGLRALNEGTLTVALDARITRELSMEGDIRDLIRGAQNARKEAGLSVTDRIKLAVFGSDKLKEAWDALGATVAAETLAVEASWARADGQIALEAGEGAWLVRIEKA